MKDQNELEKIEEVYNSPILNKILSDIPENEYLKTENKMLKEALDEADKKSQLYSDNNDLKEFTKAAMQGLLSHHGSKFTSSIGATSVDIAKATLKELKSNT